MKTDPPYNFTFNYGRITDYDYATYRLHGIPAFAGMTVRRRRRGLAAARL